MPKNRKVLCVVTSNGTKGSSGIPTGLWLSELTHPVSQFRKHGIDFEIVSIKGGTPPIDPASISVKDEINEEFMNNPSLLEMFNNTRSIDKVKSSDYVAVLYSGGHGPMWDFPNNPFIHTITREIYENGGIVSAICHGPCALFNVQLSNTDYLIKGKKLVSFTNNEEIEAQFTDIVPFLLQTALSNHQAIFQEKPNWSDNVIVDGNLITGQNPQSALDLGEVLSQAVLNNIKAEL